MGKEPVQLSRRGCLHLCAGAAPFPFLALAHSARSQTARTIKLVVPSAPGGVTDALARLFGEQIGRTQGVTVVIDNRPGAGEVIGTETAARAAPDGNTLLFAANPFVINPHLRKVSYDPLRSFEPVCQLANAPTLIVVTAGSPYHSLADLLEAARAKPGSLTMASIGPGSPFHLGFEKLKRMAKVDMTFVPYPGNGPSVNALLGEHVTMMFGTYANVAEHLKSGKLRAIAATTPRRIQELPDLPTVAESGFPDYAVPAWFASFAAAKTPKAAVSQLAAWLTAALQAPEIEQKLLIQGLYPARLCGDELAAYLRDQFDDFGRIIRESNIKAE
jgi:tripartite-type tricarboxylate transporter receptor subunit TctC